MVLKPLLTISRKGKSYEAIPMEKETASTVTPKGTGAGKRNNQSQEKSVGPGEGSRTTEYEYRTTIVVFGRLICALHDIQPGESLHPAKSDLCPVGSGSGNTRQCEGSISQDESTNNIGVISMSTNRDNQFIGFAKAVWGELETAICHDPGFIPEGTKMRRAFLPMVENIIARRAYDLACHIIEGYDVANCITTAPFLRDAAVHNIPDLPDLPKEDK